MSDEEKKVEETKEAPATEKKEETKEEPKTETKKEEKTDDKKVEVPAKFKSLVEESSLLKAILRIITNNNTVKIPDNTGETIQDITILIILFTLILNGL